MRHASAEIFSPIKSPSPFVFPFLSQTNKRATRYERYKGCCLEHIAIIIRMVNLPIGISVGREMGMIILSGIQEWREALEYGPA